MAQEEIRDTQLAARPLDRLELEPAAIVWLERLSRDQSLDVIHALANMELWHAFSMQVAVYNNCVAQHDRAVRQGDPERIATASEHLATERRGIRNTFQRWYDDTRFPNLEVTAAADCRPNNVLAIRPRQIHPTQTRNYAAFEEHRAAIDLEDNGLGIHLVRAPHLVAVGRIDGESVGIGSAIEQSTGLDQSALEGCSHSRVIFAELAQLRDVGRIDLIDLCETIRLQGPVVRRPLIRGGTRRRGARSARAGVYQV